MISDSWHMPGICLQVPSLGAHMGPHAADWHMPGIYGHILHRLFTSFYVLWHKCGICLHQCRRRGNAPPIRLIGICQAFMDRNGVFGISVAYAFIPLPWPPCLHHWHMPGIYGHIWHRLFTSFYVLWHKCGICLHQCRRRGRGTNSRMLAP